MVWGVLLGWTFSGNSILTFFCLFLIMATVTFRFCLQSNVLTEPSTIGNTLTMDRYLVQTKLKKYEIPL